MNSYKNKYYEWDDTDDDGLPSPILFDELLDNPPRLPEEIIEGVVRQGHKMMISGASKSGKKLPSHGTCYCIS